MLRINSFCKLSGASTAQGYRYIEQLENIDHIERKSGSGGHNKIAPSIEQKIVRKLKDQKKPVSMRNIAARSGVSKSTARRVAKKHNFSFKKLKRERCVA